MGQEFRGKGVNVALGPMMNMGRVAAGGRNWEGFGADPFLTGVSAAQTVKGIQDAGVIACAKHFVGNEQEHFRGGSLAGQVESSDIDDKTMHELYLWPFAESVQAGVASTMCVPLPLSIHSPNILISVLLGAPITKSTRPKPAKTPRSSTASSKKSSTSRA
jgi:beta-glucosidase-like glycosyl hydrolase